MKDVSKRTVMLPAAIPLAQMFKNSATMKKRTNVIMNVSNPDEAIHELLVSLLRKIPMMRSDDDTSSISAFLSTLPSIANNRHQISDDDLIYLANNCRLLEAKEMDIVCKVGDPPAYVYYIIEGQVTVTSLKATKYDPETLSAHTLSVMGPKTPFGEVSVLSNSARTASCVCSKPSKLMLMHGRAYFQIFSNSLVKERQQKVSVFVNNPLFSNWPLPNLMAFYESLSRQTSRRLYGDVILKQGQRSDKIWIIASGSVEVCIPSLLLDEESQKPKTELFKKKETEAEMEKKVRQNTAISPLLVLNEGSFFGFENNHNQDSSNPEAAGLTPMFTVKVSSGVCELYQMTFAQLMLNCPDKLRKNAVLKEIQRRNQFLHDKKSLDQLIIQSQHTKSIQQMQELLQKAKESSMDANVLQAQRKEDKQANDMMQTRRVPGLQLSKATLANLKADMANNADLFSAKPDDKTQDSSQLSHFFGFVSKKKNTFETEVRQRNAKLLGGANSASCSVLSSRTYRSQEKHSPSELSAREFLIRCSYRPAEFKKLGQGQGLYRHAPLSVYAEEEDTVLETRRYPGNSVVETSFSEIKPSLDTQNGSSIMVTALPEASALNPTDREQLKALISSKLIEEERGPVAARLIKLVQQRKQAKKVPLKHLGSPKSLVSDKLRGFNSQTAIQVEVKGQPFLPKLRQQETTTGSSIFDMTDNFNSESPDEKENTRKSRQDPQASEKFKQQVFVTETDLVSLSAR